MDINDMGNMLRTESVFRTGGEKSLAQAWVPGSDQKLLCRDDVLKRLMTIHKPIIFEKGEFSTNTLIYGRGGIGKTLTVRFFGRAFKQIVLKENVDIIIEYYDCLQHRSKSSLLRNISSKVCRFHSGHGYSDNEIMTHVFKTLIKEKKYLFLILDEVHNLPPDDILALLNSSISYGDKNSRFSILCISRKNDWYKIDNEKISSRIQDKIELKPYNFDESVQILEYRNKLAFRDNVINEENLELLADIASKAKNMRASIDIMRKCGRRSDERNLSEISYDMILKAQESVTQDLNQKFIDNLKKHEKLALYSIALAIRELDRPYIMIDEAYDNYAMVCENLKTEPHVKTSYRKYVRKLREQQLIIGEYLNPTKDKKGRHLQFKLLDVAPSSLIEFFEQLFKN